MSDEDISAEAYEWVKNNPAVLIEVIAGKYHDTAEGRVSVFMAGAPGAGKTEFSRCLIRDRFGLDTTLIVRIDPDEIRTQIPTYKQGKAELFNRATNKGVELLVDHCFDRKLDKSFLLDGTLAKYEKAKVNIERSLNKNRAVFVFYVYQQPEVAWRFTQAREILEGRHISKEIFIEQFIDAGKTVTQLRKDFDSRLVVFLVQKNFTTHRVETVVEIEQSGAQIDNYLKEAYTKDDLKNLL